MNQVATRSAGAVAALQGLKRGIANVKATLVKKGGDPYLRLLKDGTWVYGQEDTEIEPGSAWAINPLSIMHGWVAWKRGQDVDNSAGPVKEIMVSAAQPLPPLDSLPSIEHEPTASYEQQFSFSMVCLTGEDKGEQVLYKTASVGGVAAVDTILNAISAQLDDDPENPVPVVVLETDDYKHKKHGKTFVPVISIKTWKALTDDLPDVQAELDEQAANEPEPEPEKPAAKPARKRPAAAPKADANEDPELAALEAAIAKKKAEKDAAAKKPAAATEQDEKARRRAELQAQLEALGDGEGDDEGDAGTADDDGTENGDDATVAAQPAAQPMRRRRNA